MLASKTCNVSFQYTQRVSMDAGCPSDAYGESCSLPCPKNCQEGHCDITEGTCLGCLTGYKGPQCNESKK